MTDNTIEKIKIRPARSDDYQIIFDLCEQRFGNGYLNHKEYDIWLKNPRLFLAAEYEGTFAGTVCYLPEKAEALAKYMQLDTEYIKTVSDGKPVIHCKTAVLVPEYDHLGVMQALIEAANENSRKLGFGAAFAPAWKYNGFIPMEKLMLKLGFDEIAERQNIWYDMDGYTCIICGGKCKCTAVIYQKIF